MDNQIVKTEFREYSVPYRTVFGHEVPGQWEIYRKYTGLNRRHLIKRGGLAALTTGAMALLRSGRRYKNAAYNRSRSTIARRTTVRSRRNPQRFTSTARVGVSGIGVTTQHDARRVYRKKRMPRYRRKLWKRFSRRVHAVSEKDYGSRTVVFNLQKTFGNSTAGYQGCFGLGLYTQKSIVNYYNDLNQISGYENSGDPTAAAGATVENSTKYLFQSAIMDLTVKNDSTYRVGGTDGPDSRARLEVDVYEISVRKFPEEATSGYIGSLEDIFAQNSSKTKAIGGAGTEIEYLWRGVTPWDLTYSLGRFGVKIWKKTKYFLNNQECFTYQVRDPKRRVAMQEDLENHGSFCRKGWTRMIWITYKILPGLTVGTGDGQFKEVLSVGCTRKYFYKIEGLNDDRTRYVSQT